MEDVCDSAIIVSPLQAALWVVQSVSLVHWSLLKPTSAIFARPSVVFWLSLMVLTQSYPNHVGSVALLIVRFFLSFMVQLIQEQAKLRVLASQEGGLILIPNKCAFLY